MAHGQFLFLAFRICELDLGIGIIHVFITNKAIEKHLTPIYVMLNWIMFIPEKQIFENFWKIYEIGVGKSIYFPMI